MTTLFISDLHLDGTRPEITAQFLDFLDREARRAEALYILGDLFEAWIGDDDPDPDNRRVIQGLRSVTDAGVKTFLIHGNRDFLIGKRFCRETGVELLNDGTVVNLYGRRVLLMHGDLLCIDDHAYQRLRRIVRNPIVQFVMRRLTLRQRQRLAERMREGSKEHIASMDVAAPQIMDVNQDEVRRTFARFGVDCIIHGHTHRPAVHEMQIDGKPAVRIVLGDWYEQGSVLRWDERGFELAQLSRSGFSPTVGLKPRPTGRAEARPTGKPGVKSELLIRRGRQLGFDFRQMLETSAPVERAGTVLSEAHIHRVVPCFRCRQSAVEVAERSLQPRSQTYESLVGARLDQRAA